MVKARCQQIALEPLGDKAGMFYIGYYNEKMYCRADEKCQNMTNRAFLAKLDVLNKLIGKKEEGAWMHIPSCDKHIAERRALAKISDPESLKDNELP